MKSRIRAFVRRAIPLERCFCWFQKGKGFVFWKQHLHESPSVTNTYLLLLLETYPARDKVLSECVTSVKQLSVLESVALSCGTCSVQLDKRNIKNLLRSITYWPNGAQNASKMLLLAAKRVLPDAKLMDSSFKLLLLGQIGPGKLRLMPEFGRLSSTFDRTDSPANKFEKHEL